MAEDAVLAGLPADELKNSVSRLVSGMGYSVDSSKPVGKDFLFSAVKPDPLGGIKTMVYVSESKKRVSQNKVSAVLRRAAKGNFAKVVLISPSGFSDGALRFSAKNDVMAVDKSSLEDLMREYGLQAPKSEKIFEFAFESGMSLERARESFENSRGKKFLCFGVEEKAESVEGRYAPVGSFAFSREEEVSTGFSKTAKRISKSNVFHVNLHTNELYYISRGLGKSTTLASSDILKRLMLLPVHSVEMLSEIIQRGEVPMQELNEKYELFYEENRGDFIVLLEGGFITTSVDRKGFMPSISLPAFDNDRFDVKKFTSVKQSVSSSYPVDEIKYAPQDVLKLLELFFAGDGKLLEVIYLPYYVCRYVDDRGMRRSKTLLAPRYSP